MRRFLKCSVAVILSKLLVFCSGSSFENDPQPQSIYQPPNPNLYFEDGKNYGYSTVSNARVVIESVDTFEGLPDYEYLTDVFLGLENDKLIDWVSATTSVYLDPSSNKFYILQPTGPILSILSFSPPLGYNEIQWDLKYSVEDDQLHFGGYGIGSFIDCSLNNEEYSEGSEYATFGFTGTYDLATKSYVGNYDWIQHTDYDCRVIITGQMSLFTE